MKHKMYLAGIVTILAATMQLAPWAEAQGSTTPIIISQQMEWGMIAVNENTGAISFCANNTVVPGGGGQAPIGTCSASSIGNITPTAGNSNSLSIQVSGPSGSNTSSAALVYNNQTGQAVLCAGSGVVSGGVANVVASCKTVTNLH